MGLIRSSQRATASDRPCAKRAKKGSGSCNDKANIFIYVRNCLPLIELQLPIVKFALNLENISPVQFKLTVLPTVKFRSVGGDKVGQDRCKKRFPSGPQHRYEINANLKRFQIRHAAFPKPSLRGEEG